MWRLPNARGAASRAQSAMQRAPLLPTPLTPFWVGPTPALHAQARRTAPPARRAWRCVCYAYSLPVTAFLLCAAVYLGVGLLCLATSYEFPARGASEAFFGADCWAVDRRADHVEARVYIGTPPELYRLLVRTDASLQCGAGASSFPSVTLFSAKSLHSRSADCVEGLAGKRCYDVALVSRWVDPGHDNPQDMLSAEGSRQRLRNTRAWQRRLLRPIAFAYGADQLAGSEALELGLDGEIYLCRGASYALSAREFCSWNASAGSNAASPGAAAGHALGASLPQTDLARAGLLGSARSSYSSCRELHLTRAPPRGVLPVERLGQGTLFNNFGASSADLRMAGGAWAAAPAADAACDLTTTEQNGLATLFPAAAAVQTNYLGIRFARFVDSVRAVNVGSFEHFRWAVEMGRTCAAGANQQVARARRAFETLCLNEASLRGWTGAQLAHCSSNGVSVPFFRVADQRLEMHIDPDGRGCFTLLPDPLLRKVVTQASGSAQTDGALLKLFCIVLAAAIAWARREDETDRTDAVFARCMALFARPEDVQPFDFDIQTMSLGLISAVVRVAIAGSMFEALRADRLFRVGVSEVVLGSLSLVHWFVLYAAELVPALDWIKQRHLRPALGGSSALVDICCATMVAFSSPPLRVDVVTFDVVARLLTGVLIAITCLSRCLLSAACAGAFVARGAALPLPWALGSALMAGGFWVLQSASVAIVLCDLLAVPAAMDATRLSTGERSLTALVLFLAVSLFGAPRLTANAALLAERLKSAPKDTR